MSVNRLQMHPNPMVRKQYAGASDMQKLVKFHRKEARQFANDIEAFCRKQQKKVAPGKENPWKGIHVHCLVMDLLGEVRNL